MKTNIGKSVLRYLMVAFFTFHKCHHFLLIAINKKATKITLGSRGVVTALGTASVFTLPHPKNMPPKDTQNLDNKLYVKVSEASELMGIGKTYIYNEMNTGRLPAKKCGKRTLIAIEDINRWFNSLPIKK